VLDQDSRIVRRGDEPALARLRAREGLVGLELAARIVSERGAVRTDRLATLAGVTSESLERLDGVERLKGAANYLVDTGFAQRLASAAGEHVGAHHEAHPLAPGMPVADLRRLLGVEDELFGALLEGWAAAGALVRNGPVVALPQRATALPPDQRAIADSAIEKLRSAGASPPPLRDLGVGTELARALDRSGELLLLTTEIAYPSDVWEQIERTVAALITTNGPVSVAQVREALGTSRKYAVPMLERLDALSVTRRTGDVRELGPRGRQLVESSP